MNRTHMCGEITKSNENNNIVINGWVDKTRNLGGLIFGYIRDKKGKVQVMFDEEILGSEGFKLAEDLKSEYVVEIEGKVVKRSEKNINEDEKTGEIEIHATKLKILSKSDTPPFHVYDGDKVNEELRLKYKYLDLRRPKMQKNFMIRNKLYRSSREFFYNENFMEIETPMLAKSTPEGARDYLVPSRVHPGEFYALPQSPQTFKQLLMISGFDRYFQIVKCFRDEDLRADRQPEFTQIDTEMSFVDVEDVLEINERHIKKIFKDVIDLDVELPIKRMKYEEAMRRFGSDKPDLRFDMELKDLSEVVKDSKFNVFSKTVESGGSVRGINAKGCANFGRKKIDRLEEFVKDYKAKGLAWIALKEDGEIKSPITKFLSDDEVNNIIDGLDAKKGDLLLIIADKNKVVFDSLGALRIHIAEKLDIIDDKKFEFVWITEFPLLEYKEDEDRYVAAHHPFTMPMDEDIEKMETDPSKVRAKAYDIVLNGYEIGGGSIRIYKEDIQEKMFETIGMDKEEANEKFGFLLEAFKYGVPPHGGIAYGLDRLVMLMANDHNIRNVIAFPKTKEASCLLTEAPSGVSKKQLNELNIEIKKQED